MGLIDEQANLMISALEMKDKKVIELMIPIRNTFMIDYDDILDKFKLNLILDKGYSRIPVYANHNKNDIQGLLRIKQLIGIDIDRNKSLRQYGIELRKPIVISPTLSVFDLLKEFRKGKSHMAFITEQVEDLQNKFGLNAANSLADLSVMKNSLMGNELQKRNSYNGKNIKILGIITLEDVIEKMTNLDILDEDDYEDKMRNLTKRDSNSKINKIINKKIKNLFIYFNFT
jgi:metal transporter CNNM